MTISHLVISTIYAMLPMRGYVQPQQPVLVAFDTARTARARRAVQVGLRAERKLGGFTPTALGDIVSDQNKPLFHLYTFSGKAIAPRPVKRPHIVHGTVDLRRYYPEIEKTGTYILTWKNAAPLVIETLNNPGAPPLTAATLKAMQPQLEGLTAEQKAQSLNSFRPVAIAIKQLQYARIKTGDGIIKARFYYNVAPHTVANFISLAQERFYDGSNFHRIIKNFMIQGGDSVSNIPGRAGSGGPGYNMVQEFNNKPHVAGVLSMARLGGDVNTAGSQFFIVTQPSPFLNGKYTAFGKVFKGMHVVRKIANTPVRGQNGTVVGKKPPIISIRIRPATAAMYGIGRSAGAASAKPTGR